MSELPTGDALSRRVAEILGWTMLREKDRYGQWEDVGWRSPNGGIVQAHFDFDENQATAAVKEWCGDDERRPVEWLCQLRRIQAEDKSRANDLNEYRLATASATQKCQALVAAAKALKGK